MHFLLFTQENFEKFLKKFPNNCVFRQNPRKFNAGFWNVTENRQNNAFLLFSQDIFENFLKNSPNNCVFRPKRENLTQGFEIILKIDQNNAFFVFFQRNLWKFSQTFPRQVGFSSKVRKFNAGFFNFFEKSPKIIHFLQFSLGNFFWNFQNFLETIAKNVLF